MQGKGESSVLCILGRYYRGGDGQDLKGKFGIGGIPGAKSEQ